MIALGLGIYACAVIVGFILYIGTLILAKDYIMAVFILGGVLIVVGYLLRRFFKDSQ